MNRGTSLIDLSGVSGVAGAQPARAAPRHATPNRDVLAPSRPTCEDPHAPTYIRRKSRGRGAIGRGIAHANCFPAAGRLMRAGRAGAGGGSGARAHRPPSRSGAAPARGRERDGDSSRSQRRLVNTNRPKSRDKYSTFTTRTHTAARPAPCDAHRRTRLANRSLAAAPLCYF
ncbi:hypothetical protein KGM_213598 [Danaus plexippus plexippus]|uniref:Uncharacterized protein n=1 Tax=Danaus plexippus plexippus TaxID=278856 RepID=A0A212ENV8_DANPL|nr:hypothetical protein KGM_213598 [Danaus plexippus plexippus]